MGVAVSKPVVGMSCSCVQAISWENTETPHMKVGVYTYYIMGWKGAQAENRWTMGVVNIYLLKTMVSKEP